jgi:hypothetical protein
MSTVEPCPIGYSSPGGAILCTFEKGHDRVGHPGGKNITLFDHGNPERESWWNNDSRYLVVDHQPGSSTTRPDDVGGMGLMIADVSRWIDESPRNKLNTFTENLLLRTSVKIGEETGELNEALIGMLGQNPRKQTAHTMVDVEKELLEIAFTALGAIEFLHQNDGSSAIRFAGHVVTVTDRMLDAKDAVKAKRLEFEALIKANAQKP